MISATQNAQILNRNQAENATRLSGWRLVAARSVVFPVIGLTVLLYLIAVPGLIARLSVICEDTLNTCLLSPEQIAPLGKLGLTPQALAVSVAVISWLGVLLSCGVAALLLWRRSDDWMALLVALTLTLMPANFTPAMQGLNDSLGVVTFFAGALSTVSLVTWSLLIALFPSGRFVPRWLWIVVAADVLLDTGPTDNLPNALVLPLTLGIILSYIGGQIYRYRRASSPVERQQTKWAVSGLVLTLIVNQVYWQPAGWIEALSRPDSLYTLLLYPDSFLMVGILAVAFGVAILRYRLYDIDVIIRRTLIYGTLTAILAGVYFGSVIAMQQIVRGVTGQEQSAVVIVLSTLLIAALFQPLRRGIQRGIDRRFFRSKYDAAKTVAAFSATVRNETDLPSLTNALVAVVGETLQPAHVSLWLRRPSQA